MQIDNAVVAIPSIDDSAEEKNRQEINRHTKNSQPRKERQNERN